MTVYSNIRGASVSVNRLRVGNVLPWSAVNLILGILLRWLSMPSDALNVAF
jgi:hypothetical protein